MERDLGEEEVRVKVHELTSARLQLGFTGAHAQTHSRSIIVYRHSFSYYHDRTLPSVLHGVLVYLGRPSY